jgi:hypothetical protein
MEFPRRAHEPQREKRHNAACSPSGHESHGSRGHEDLVRERNDEIHHPAEHRTSVSNGGPTTTKYTPPQQHSIWKTMHHRKRFSAKYRSCYPREEYDLQ